MLYIEKIRWLYQAASEKAISLYSALEQENKNLETSNELLILKNQLMQIDNEILIAKE
ncbi:TPA: hypothetical protein J1452_004038 [Escherichia coli]|uniref:hypothetical protein n=1 Tax=Escherichia coli TaxID=562 RepID=UPI00157B58B1|nr:hypothetical protein [Escherichia coli]HBA9677632.1 hypothetical protein [Escherichia coli]HBB0203977.1 hypothetical protein [Escherichia coli]